MSDIDPAEAARMAQAPIEGGEAGGMDDVPPAFGGGPGPSAGRESWLMEGLKSTSPHRPIDQVEGADDLARHWQRYGVRGLEKFTGADGQMAGVDFLRSLVGAMIAYSKRLDSGEEESADDGLTADDGLPTLTEDGL